MNRTDHCPACQGGGLVPPPDCACDGNAHNCTPVICPRCNGSGRARCVRSAVPGRVDDLMISYGAGLQAARSTGELAP
jgi:hypothetical protein